MKKNTASQTWTVFAFDRTDNTPKTGDAAQITAKIKIDGGSLTATDDTNPTEVEDGFYEFTLTQAETNGDKLFLTPESSTSDIQVVACPAVVYTDNVGTQVQTVIETNNLDHLCKTATAAADMTTEVADNTILSRILSNGDTSAFDPTTDGLQLIRDAITDASPQNHSATANNETTGSLISGTYADTVSVNTTYYTTAPAGAAVGGFGLNVDLTFDIGIGRSPNDLNVTGFFASGAQRTVQVWVYDYELAEYVQVSTGVNAFGNAVANQTYQYSSLTSNMVNAVTGEVKVRFTSTSTETADRWNCDFIQIQSVAQEAAGLTANAIQAAVWNRSSLTSNHDESTLGYVLSNIYLVEGEIVSVTSTSQFILDGDATGNDAYNGMVIVVEDETTGFYEARRVVDYIGATKEVFLDRALSFTPEAGDHFYLMGTGYADVNTTHVAGTTQTAKDLGAQLDVAVSTRSSHTAANVWEVGTRTLTSFGTLVADTASAVWGAVTRTLTAFSFTPSLDAAYDAAKMAAQAGEAASALTAYDPPTKTEMDNAFAALNDVSTADVDSAVIGALAGYDLPTQTEMDASFAALNDITVAEIIAGIADGDYDLQEMLRVMFAVLAGRSTGGGTTALTFRDSANSKARVTVTVDSSGNRTAITLDGS